MNANTGRPKKPAVLKRGNSESQEELEARQEREEALMGGTDKLEQYIKQPPKHLDKVAQEYFKFIANELEVAKILSNLDIPLLEATSTCLSRMRNAEEILQDEGLYVYKDDMDNVGIEHPMARTYRSYQSEFRQLSGQLGLSPSSRATLASLEFGKQKEENDALAQILLGNQEDQSERVKDMFGVNDEKEKDEKEEQGDE